MEFTCRAAHKHTYQIYLDWGILKRIGSILKEHKLAGPFYMISDTNVFRHHGKMLLHSLKGYETHYLLIQPGETSKSLANWRRIQDFFLENGADRRSVVIAFGGGVVGDLAGFAASTFMRGL